MKRTLLFVALIAVLVLSACVVPPSVAQPGMAQAAAPAQQTGQPAQLRTIAVNGSGQVTLSPDVAYVYIGVSSQSPNVADALRQNNQSSQSVARALQELTIEPKDIQTSGFNVRPQQQFGPQGEITGTTYTVDNTVYVTVRDLQVLGKLLDVVVRSGANSINGISFDVLDKSQAISEARRLAVESARSQADELAQLAGVTVDALQTMNVYASNNPVPVFEGKGAAMDASQVAVSAGQLVIRVDVNAIYTIH